MGEIIRVEVTGTDGRSISWIDVVTGRTGSGTGAEWLPVGSEAVIEIEERRGRCTISRVLEPRPSTATSRVVDPMPLLVNGVPLTVGDPPAPTPAPRKRTVTVGDVRPAKVPFSAFSTADRDRGSVDKLRPSVVVAIEDDHVAVQAIFGTNSAVRRSGSGIRLRDWRQTGLRKSSVVTQEVTWVAPSDVGELIGTLSERDRRRVLREE